MYAPKLNALPSIVKKALNIFACFSAWAAGSNANPKVSSSRRSKKFLAASLNSSLAFAVSFLACSVLVAFGLDSLAFFDVLVGSSTAPPYSLNTSSVATPPTPPANGSSSAPNISLVASTGSVFALSLFWGWTSGSTCGCCFLWVKPISCPSAAAIMAWSASLNSWDAILAWVGLAALLTWGVGFCSTSGAACCSVRIGPVGAVTGLEGTTGLDAVCCSVTPSAPSAASLLSAFLVWYKSNISLIRVSPWCSWIFLKAVSLNFLDFL